LPLSSFLVVAIAIVALGNIFLSLGQQGTIILGLAIIVLVPSIGFIIVKMGGDE
jgi:hypothetical protein